MTHILLSGEWLEKTKQIEKLIMEGFAVTCLPIPDEMIQYVDMIIIRSNNERDFERYKNLDIPWFAWCSSNDNALNNEAYQCGASAVFNSDTPFETIIHHIKKQNKITNKKEYHFQTMVERKFLKGDHIFLEEGMVLQIKNGIIAQTMVYRDGNETLLGLFGPRQIIIPHPEDTCFIQLFAQTDTTVLIKPWSIAIQENNFSEKLKAKLQQMEAWSAIQARPHLDQKIIGILSLLSEQFGVSVPQGTLINVKLTHAQLASAVGTTRTTITKMIGDLRRIGLIRIIETEDGERLCLTQSEKGHHCSNQEEINNGY